MHVTTERTELYVSLSNSLLVLALLGGFSTAAIAKEQPVNKSDLIYGVNVVWGDSGTDDNWKSGDRAAKLAALMKEMGVTNTRLGIHWCGIEETRGTYKWARYDELLDFILSQGVKVVACISNPPTWSSGADDDPDVREVMARSNPGFLTVLPPQEKYLPDFRRWIAAVAKRYKGKITCYEIGNELDACPAPILIRDARGKVVDCRLGGDPDIYTKMLKICYEEIKKADPAVKVAICGLQGEDNTYFVQQIYAFGGGDSFDCVGMHPYHGKDTGIKWEWLEQMHDLMVRMGQPHKTFYLTEYGWNIAGPDDSEEDQKRDAEVLERTLVEMRNWPWIEQASLHTLNDWRTDESNPDSVTRMGACTWDLQKKQAFYAFQRAATGKSTAKGILDGQRQKVIESSGVPQLLTCESGEPVKVTVSVKNLSSQVVKGDVVCDKPEGWSVKPESDVLSIQPGETVRLPVTITPPADVGVGRYPVNCRIVGKEMYWLFQSTVGVPLRCSRLAVKPKIDGDLTGWTGDGVVVSKEGSDTKGVFRIGWDNDNFYFACEVRDVQAYQPYIGEWLWRADSVQLGFDPDREDRRWKVYGYEDSECCFALSERGVEAYRNHGSVELPIGLVFASFDAPVVARKPLKAAVVWKEGGYRYEIAIPWDEITPGKRPKVGGTMGLSVVINYDGPDHKRQALEWGGGIVGDKDPSQFVPVRFEE